MPDEPAVRPGDQPFVEPLLGHARLVASDQQDRLTFRIERERHPPYSVRCLEAQLLHVGVLGPGQGVGMRPAKRRAVDFQQRRHGQELVLDLGG